MLMFKTPIARSTEAACVSESGVSFKIRNVTGNGSVVTRSHMALRGR